MKRFYGAVGVDAVEDGFEIRLDGRPVRTPARHWLRVPAAGLADAIAVEWRDQEKVVKPETMPLTRLANTAIDQVGSRRTELADAVAAYGGTDLLCYRADEPEELAARQTRQWQPILDWVALRYDAALRVASGVMPVEQPAGALKALRTAIDALDPWWFTGLQSAVATSGSLVLGLALVDGRINGEQAFELAQLDESYQVEQWGEDAEAIAREHALRAELLAVERFLNGLGRPS